MNKTQKKNPPFFVAWLLRRLSRYTDRYSLLNDFEIEYSDLAAERGCWIATVWYIGQTMKTIPGLVCITLYWRFSMFRNYLRITLRILKNNKTYTSINITGLAVGMACSMLIFVFVQHELSYDRFHPDAEQIYQVLSHTDINNWSISPTPLGPALKEEFPEILETSRYHWIWGGAMVSYEDRSFNIERMRFGDPSFFRLFHFPFIQGDPETALTNPNSIVITKAMAQKYFGEVDALGKVLTLNQKYPLTVTGIVDNFPANSTIRFDILAPIEFNMQNLVDYERYNTWDNIIVVTYIKCRDNEDTDVLNEKIIQFVNKHRGRETLSFTLLPLTERHFFFTSSKASVYVFLFISIFILVIACFNFMNLAIARSARRIKEIGMRKIVGAYRRQIIGQFLGESILISIIAGLCAAVLFFVLFPIFETIIGKTLILRTTSVALHFTTVALLTGLVSGSYPSLFLSKVRLIQALKGRSESGPKGGRLR